MPKPKGERQLRRMFGILLGERPDKKKEEDDFEPKPVKEGKAGAPQQFFMQDTTTYPM